LKVTANLLLFLRFRTSDSSQLLWIDAVNINQDDLDERSQQVSLMGTIYQNAKVVLIWIGDQTPGSLDPTPMFRRLSEILAALELRPGRTKFNFLPYVEGQTVDASTEEWIQAPQQGAYWAAVRDWTSKTYWDRLWIIQEIVLSSTTVVLCGQYRLDWKCFSEAVQCVYTLKLSQLYQPYIPGLGIRVSCINDLGYLNYTDSSPSATLIFNLFLHAKVTDPRDHIYGFLGILDRHKRKHQIHVDYSSTVEEIFRSAVADIVSQTQDLGLFNALTIGPEARHKSSMPSWVRDWEPTPPIFYPIITPQVQKRLGYEQTVIVEGEYLTGLGLIIDSIEHVSATNFRKENILPNILMAFIDNLHSLDPLTAGDPAMAAAKTLQYLRINHGQGMSPAHEQAFCTLLAQQLSMCLSLSPISYDETSEPSEPPAILAQWLPPVCNIYSILKDLARNDVLRGWLATQSSAKADMEEAHLELERHLMGEDSGRQILLGVNMFKSKKGFCGIGPAGFNRPADDPVVRVGDHIVLFPTVRGPMIIRERVGEDAYTLIGCAHVGNILEFPWYEGDTPKLVPIRLR
jgi:hypothetical protein